MIAYIDESYDGQNHAYTVAGFVSPDYLWARFESRWLGNLSWAGLQHGFHTTEFESRLNEFSGWSDRKWRELEERIVDTIHDSITVGVAHSMVMADHRAVFGDSARLLRRAAQHRSVSRAVARRMHATAEIAAHPYAYLLKAWLQQVAKLLPMNPGAERITCVLEQNNEVEGTSQRMFSKMLRARSDLEQRYHETLVFSGPEEFVPLQAADLLAHHANKSMVAMIETGIDGSPSGVLKRLCELGRVHLSYHDQETMRASIAGSIKLGREIMRQRGLL